MFLKKYPFFSIDIETRNLSAKAIEFEKQFLKPHPSTKDEDKKMKQLEEKARKLKEKGAVTDSCEIASIGIHVQGEMPIVIHTFDFHEDLKADYGMEHYPCVGEKEMLRIFYELMSSACDETTELVVAGRDFDFPKIRTRNVVNGVPIPEPLVPGAQNPNYDVLFMGAKYFLVNKRFSVSLDELSQRLGVDTGEKAISGAEVPGMIERGEFKEVIIYNGLDAVKNTECYMKMTCRY